MKDGAAEVLTADTSVLGPNPQIRSSYANGVLTLCGNDTVENYQAVLRTVKYADTARKPNVTQRVITFLACDNVMNSNTATTRLSIR